MKVTLIASTQVDQVGHQDKPYATDEWLSRDDPWTTLDSDFLGEFAGRACYQAWNRPRPETATNAGYLANIIKQAHFSVLEHASATFYVERVSRSLTHELVRHRHLSYSQLSQRYVKPADDGHWVQPPNIPHASWAGLVSAYGPVVADMYNTLVAVLEERGTLSKKQVREAARAILPNATETKIVVTGNMRAWRDFLAKRWHVAADAEICEFAGKILDHLRSIAPNSFQDIPEKPYGSKQD